MMITLIVAIIIICIAHIFRVIRWELFIKTYEMPDRQRMTESLSLGYFLNYFFPFKIGDFFRALYAGKTMKNGRGFALASVIVERCIDVITVGIIFTGFSIAGNSGESAVGRTVIYYIAIAAVLLTGLILIYCFRDKLKKVIAMICGLFNSKYEEKILRFFWALIWGFKDILNRLPKLKLIIYTVVMWGLYVCSYAVFSVFLNSVGVGKNLSDVLFSLFDQKALLSSGIVNGVSINSENIWYAFLLLLPCLILFIVAKLSFLQRKSDEQAAIIMTDLNLIPQTNSEERRTFLKMYFSGDKKEYIENYLKINRNIFVLRDYSAGSNATTILCTDGVNSFYRKYAFMDAAEKLSEQIKWLDKFKEVIPVADIIRRNSEQGVCYYDMTYSDNALTLFEYIQGEQGDIEKTWEIIKRVLDCLEKNVYIDKEKINYNQCEEDNHNTITLANDVIEEYIDKKVLKNLDIILNSESLSEILEYKTLKINGKEYRNITEYISALSKDNLRKVFCCDEISNIHGDLTIENIVYDRQKDDFYIIDPNTGNILDSKFIDYAKILQSLHGRYEYLREAKDVKVNGNVIDFTISSTTEYEDLCARYTSYLRDRFDEKQVKSIYYHEIANWLRLMPYKLKKGDGMVFYCGFIRLLNDVVW